MASLQKEGYEIHKLKNPDVISEFCKSVAKINFEFANNINRDICNYDTSLFETDVAKKRKLFEEVKGIFKDELSSILPGFKPLMINFWSKKPGHGEVEMHQNWSHVDERQHRSYSIWIPLQDTDTSNGTMHLIPFTHSMFSSVRGIRTDYFFREIPATILNKLFIEVKLKKGEFVVFDDAILHFTSANNSTANRDAMQLVVIPNDAQAKFYYKNDSGIVDEYNADENYYMDIQVSSGESGLPSHVNKQRELKEAPANKLWGACIMIANRMFRYHQSVIGYSK